MRGIALALLATLGVVVVAIGLVFLNPFGPPGPEAPMPSPTAIAGVSPSAAPAEMPSPGASPTPTAPASPSTTSEPTLTLAPEPSAPVASPTGAPATASPGTAPPATTVPTATAHPSPSPSPDPQLGWIEVTDFPTYPRTTEVTSITAGGPEFVAVGNGGRRLNGRVWTSRDGLRWTAQPDGVFATYSLDIVVRAGDALYSFGRGHEGLRVWRSSSGRDWTGLDESPELQWAWFNDVAASGGTLIAVGHIDDPEGNFGPAVWRSSDGVSWQRAGNPAGLPEIWDIAVRGSTVVGIGRWPHLSGPVIVYSTDMGDSWHAAAADIEFGVDGPGGGLVTVAANDRRFVAVGHREGANDHEPIALTSVDGTDWASVALPAAGGGGILEQVVAIRGGRFVALGTERSRSIGSARLTTDGRAWTDLRPVYTGQSPPMPPEGGDKVVTGRSIAASRDGVVVAQEWGDGVRVWFGPIEMFE